jgi:hypothetical protein
MSLSNLRLAAAAAVLAVTAGPAGADYPLSGAEPDSRRKHVGPRRYLRHSIRMGPSHDGVGLQVSVRDHHPGRIGGDIFRRSLPNGVQYGDGWMPVGPPNLLTTDDFEVFIGGGFNPFSNYLGTFPETFVSATFTGDVGGNAVVDELDPSRASLGSVTISAAPGGGFFIDNRAAIFGVYTINGGDPITVPVALTVGAPKPSTWAMMLLGFGGFGFAGYRRRRKRAGAARA